MMNKTEVFQKVWDHFVTNKNKPALIEIPNSPVGIFHCRYRGLNNTKCSIGVLISDDKYKPEMEQLDPLQVLIACDVIPKDGVDQITAMFIRDIQIAHDVTVPLEDKFLDRFTKMMQAIAHKYNINYQAASSNEVEASNNNGLFAQT